MKALKIVSVLVLIVLVVLMGGLFYLNHYVQTPAFKAAVLTAARDSLGTEVKVTEMNVSLLEGVTLKGITIANPAGFTGNLLMSDSFVLRYRLWPLLSKRVEIQKLAIERPVVALVRDASGAFNYEKIGGQSAPKPAATAPSSNSSGTSLNIDLSSLSVSDGEVSLASDTGKTLVKLVGLSLQASVSLAGEQMSGQGDAQIGELNLADSLFIRQLKTPVMIDGGQIQLSPLAGTLAEGKVGGGVTIQTAGTFKYIVDLTVKEADVAKLLAEMKTKPLMTGKLQLTTKLEGTAGLSTITGGGKVEIVDGQLSGVAVQNLIGSRLKIPDLQNLKFTECVLEYTIANNVLQTPVIKITSPTVQLTGKGVMELTNYTLNHTFTLALAKSALEKAPKEVRAIFTDRGDGFLTLNFKVTGPYDAPKTDLAEILLEGAGQQLLEKGLQKLFK